MATRYKIRTEKDISDANITVINNTSGTNTGDNATNTTYEPAKNFQLDVNRFGFLKEYNPLNAKTITKAKATNKTKGMNS